MPDESSVPEQRMGSRVLVCLEVTGYGDMALQNCCVLRKRSDGIKVEMKIIWEIPEIWHLKGRESPVF